MVISLPIQRKPLRSQHGEGYHLTVQHSVCVPVFRNEVVRLQGFSVALSSKAKKSYDGSIVSLVTRLMTYTMPVQSRNVTLFGYEAALQRHSQLRGFSSCWWCKHPASEC